MHIHDFRRYLSGEAMDESLEELNKTLAAHKAECEAHKRKCPYEAKLKKKIEEKKEGDDKADEIGGVSKRRTAKISGTVGKKEEGDEIVGKAIDDIIDNARESDEYDSSSFGDACGSVWDTLFEEAIEEFGDDDGNLDLDAWDKGKDAWIKEQKDGIDDRVGNEIRDRNSYFKEQESYYWRHGRMPNW